VPSRAPNLADYAARVDRDGAAVAPIELEQGLLAELGRAIERIPRGDAVRQKESIYGVRNLLETCPEVCQLANRDEIRRCVVPILGAGAFATRAIFFNKTPDANWALGWHQDSVISVAEKIETPGFRAWGLKAGVWQVQPPPEVLAQMLAIRVHLDDCGPDNGALRVIPGSHRHGWLDDEIAAWKQRAGEITLGVPAGAIIAMRPLILHASSRALRPERRRVIHIEFACNELPGELEWNNRIEP